MRWAPAWARLRASRPATTGIALVAGLAIFALLGPVVARWDPDASDFSLRRGAFGAPPGPSAAHWLGVDPLYRDVFARLAQGARLSLSVAIAATALATTIGVAVGVAAGMTEGGRFRAVDAVLMRLVDVMLALPFLLFVTAIGLAVGRTDVGTVLAVLGLVGWTGTARLVRARTLQVRSADFVTAARALGARPLRIVLHHVLPNVAGTALIVATTSVGGMILAEAVLGYLTVGIQPPRATWGRMLHEGEPYLGTRLALVVIPGFAILLATLGFSRLGDGLKDALAGDDRNALPSPSRRLPVDLLLAAAAMLLLSSATPNGVAPPLGADPAHDAPRRGGVLHVASFVAMRTLDPALAYDEGSRRVLQHVFARLVTWDAEGRLVPDLARAVEASPDGRTYTFELRDTARFHDGTPVLARDVKRSLERLLHPKTPTPAASMYATIAGFDAFHAGRAPELSGVRVLGERLLAIDLTAPDATFLPKMTLAFAAPVCASAGVVADPRAPWLPCGAGPFRVAAWDPDRRVTLVRHEGYHASGLPYLDGIDWSLNVPYTTQRYSFERGELDYVNELAGADREIYLASRAWSGRGRWSSNATTEAVFLNTELPPFDRREVRRAVALALDPSAIERMRADLVTADRVVPPSIPGPAARPPMRRHDLAAALDAMARAGYPFDPATGAGGFPGPAVEYLATSDTADQAYGEIWQQQLAKIGLRLRLRLVTYATFLAESERRRTAQMGKAGWSADFPDPSNFFEPILATAAIEDEGSENVSFFSDPELDAVLARAHGEPDPAARDALYERAEEIVRDEAPWIPTFGTRSFELWQPALRGYAAHPILRSYFAGCWLDRGEGAALAALGLPLAPRRAR